MADALICRRACARAWSVRRALALRGIGSTGDPRRGYSRWIGRLARGTWLTICRAMLRSGSTLLSRAVSSPGGAHGLLFQVACSAEYPPCNASRSCGTAGSYSQSGQKSAPGVAPRRQRCVLHAAFGSNRDPLRRQAQGSRFPAWKLSGPPSNCCCRSQVQESIVACRSP